MQLLIDKTKLELLLVKKKQHIGKTLTLDSLMSSISFLISVYFASYETVLGISGNTLKVVFSLLGIVFLFKSIYDLWKNKKCNYTYNDLFTDINTLNEITHNHSIVIVKDSFNKHPGRFLVYDDNAWGCRLFINYKENENNEDFIKSHLSSELKVDISDITLKFTTMKIHEKLSQRDKINKMYCHKFYLADIKKFPLNTKNDTFTIDGKTYHWVSIATLEADKNAMAKNSDVISFVKEYF